MDAVPVLLDSAVILIGYQVCISTPNVCTEGIELTSARSYEDSHATQDRLGSLILQGAEHDPQYEERKRSRRTHGDRSEGRILRHGTLSGGAGLCNRDPHRPRVGPIAHVNMENAGVRFSRNGSLEEGLAGNQVNAEDVLSPIKIGRRLIQRKHEGSFDGTAEIDPVGAFFRRLEILKHPREWDIRAPIEDQSDYSLGIIVNQSHSFLCRSRLPTVAKVTIVASTVKTRSLRRDMTVLRTRTAFLVPNGAARWFERLKCVPSAKPAPSPMRWASGHCQGLRGL